MNFITRKAVESDLPYIREMYKKIIEKMDSEGICIWHDGFPYPVICERVPRGEFYVLTDDSGMIAGFSITEKHEHASAVSWHISGKPVYFGLFGVRTDMTRKGVGSMALREAAKLAKDQGGDCLRLFAVDINAPAVRLYEKNGFIKADGILTEDIGKYGIAHEYGFELDLSGNI